MICMSPPALLFWLRLVEYFSKQRNPWGYFEGRKTGTELGLCDLKLMSWAGSLLQTFFRLNGIFFGEQPESAY